MATPLRQTYQLKVVLEHVKPQIWRRLIVPSSLRLDELHVVLQAAMGWSDSHLHEFRRDSECWSECDPESPCQDERKQRLDGLLARDKDALHYTYDFGDNWEHKIELEKILRFDPAAPRPRCLKGVRACPPEDCGGPWGYQRMLKIMKDPKHPEYEDLVEWLGDEEFDPKYFDLDKINSVLDEVFS